jgi:hypothetical protein
MCSLYRRLPPPPVRHRDLQQPLQRRPYSESRHQRLRAELGREKLSYPERRRADEKLDRILSELIAIEEKTGKPQSLQPRWWESLQ